MTDDSIQDFEQRLGQIETASRRGDSLTDLLRSCKSGMAALTSQPEVIVVVTAINQIQILVGTPSDDECRTIAHSVESSALFEDVTIEKKQTDEKVGSINRWNVLVRRGLSAGHSCLCFFLLTEDPRNRSILLDAAKTLADILTEAAARTLLSDLTQELKHHEDLKPLIRRLGRCATPELWAQDVAQYGVEHLGKGRVSVFKAAASEWQLMSVTGSASPSLHSDAVRRNEQLVSFATKLSLRSRWLSATHPEREYDEPLRILLAQYAALGVEQVRVEAIPGLDGSVNYTVLLEVFDVSQRPGELLLEMVRHEITDAAHVLPRSMQAVSGIFATTTRKLMFVLSVVVLTLMLTPADFEIEVSGQAFPKERRRIFAPDDGLVEELLVTSDERVSARQSILRLRNPERELELNRILGEVESIQSRIQAIRTTRTSSVANNGTNTANRSAELSSEEQQLGQKLSALVQAQKLVEQQIDALTITAPIDGTIYQRRLQEQLLSRPAQRGQLLLEIVNTEGEWELELQIPESVVGYVQEAAGKKQTSSQSTDDDTTEKSSTSSAVSDGLGVQFTFTSRVRELHSTKLSSLDLATHLYDGQLRCLATAVISNQSVADLRPGQAVTARINCGRKSLGFIWFREVVEFWQRKKFTWL